MVGEVNRDTETFFTRVAVRKELQPTKLNRLSADAQSFDQHAGSSTRLVRGVCGRNNAGILSLTEEDVAGETAGSQHHAVLCFNSSGTAALVFNIVALQFRVEAIAFTIGHTDDSAVFVQDEIIELGTRHDLDVGELLEFIMHRNDVSGSGAGLDFIRTRNGVTGFEEHLVGDEFAAAVHNHLDGVIAAVGDRAEQVRVVNTQTVFQAVGNEEFLAVFDALGSLDGVDRASDVAAADCGVAADSRHFFEDQNFLACLAGFQCAGHAGKTGTDNDDVIFVIKFSNGRSRDSGVCGSGGSNGSSGCTCKFKEVTAIGTHLIFSERI